ncbi:PKD domain-containing protein [Marinobacterium aestuariivivens]|uniref:PKD domain-containing protein n=1 Tax=Marinobacterium aestuariivivens TaxID=1698799 RepID=A0ABW2A1W9_9GAMM
MQIPKRCTQYALYFAMSALLMLFDSLLPVYGETIVFGPEQFDRGRAKPRPEVRHFSIWNPDDDFTLIVQNGDGEDESTRVSSAIITINGIQILGPEDFSKQVDLIEIPVSLADGNEIVVENIEIRGEPGSFLIVSIFGTNTAPIANAGKDNSALTGVSFSLDGSKSFDPDGDAITFGWSAVGAPPGSTATLQDTASIKPSFIPDQPGDYVFELVVNDGEVDSTPDQVTVTAVADIAPPNADAGEDQNALIGIPVLLDGSNSQDPNGFLLSFTWIFESLPPESALTDADIVFANTPAPQFTPDTVGNYVLRLDVGNGASNDTDRVQIIASESNVPPNADAGPDIAVRTSQAAKLDGSGSTDPDQGPLPLADSWSLIGRPDGSTLTSADLIPSDQAITTLIPDVEGDYLARLKVDDGEASDEDNVLIFGDNTAPDIGFLSPVEGSTVTSMPEIRVFFSDDGSGLDLSSYQTTINGIDVTSGTFVSPYGASYTPAAPLPVGENEATAQIADLAGNVQTTMITFTVGGFAAIADCAPTSGEVPLAVRFRSRGEFDGGSIVLYRWDFQGDGVFDTVDSVAKDYSFTFNTQGTFNAVLEVTNNFGDTATDTCTIQVGGNAPIAIANASPSNGPVPLDVNLTCTGSDADGTIVLYEWDFDGDGSFDYSNPSSGSVMHTYSQEGTFVALCRVTDNDGLTGEARTTTTLIRPAPQALLALPQRHRRAVAAPHWQSLSMAVPLMMEASCYGSGTSTATGCSTIHPRAPRPPALPT